MLLLGSRHDIWRKHVFFSQFYGRSGFQPTPLKRLLLDLKKTQNRPPDQIKLSFSTNIPSHRFLLKKLWQDDRRFLSEEIFTALKAIYHGKLTSNSSRSMHDPGFLVSQFCKLNQQYILLKGSPSTEENTINFIIVHNNNLPKSSILFNPQVPKKKLSKCPKPKKTPGFWHNRRFGETTGFFYGSVKTRRPTGTVPWSFRFGGENDDVGIRWCQGLPEIVTQIWVAFRWPWKGVSC